MLAVFGLALNANAVTVDINPESTFLLDHGMSFTSLAYDDNGDGIADGANTTSQSVINRYLNSTYEGLFKAYKSDVGSGESGSLLDGSYTTTFGNDPNDPSEAIISYDGGLMADSAYLLVKDGNTEPMWYLFDLTASGAGWNGISDLKLTEFWDNPEQNNRGAISHVTLYTTPEAVPDNGPTLVLLGSALAALTFAKKRKQRE